jgi:hypothetical protein
VLVSGLLTVFERVGLKNQANIRAPAAGVRFLEFPLRNLASCLANFAVNLTAETAKNAKEDAKETAAVPGWIINSAEN